MGYRTCNYLCLFFCYVPRTVCPGTVPRTEINCELTLLASQELITDCCLLAALGRNLQVSLSLLREAAVGQRRAPSFSVCRKMGSFGCSWQLYFFPPALLMPAIRREETSRKPFSVLCSITRCSATCEASRPSFLFTL